MVFFYGAQLFQPADNSEERIRLINDAVEYLTGRWKEIQDTQKSTGITEATRSALNTELAEMRKAIKLLKNEFNNRT